MPENNIRIYEILSKRVEHLEKAKLAIIVALITLTTLLLTEKLNITITNDWEHMILYLPFATLVSLNYGLFVRVLELVKSIGNIELRDEDFKELDIKYYSMPSKHRIITYVYVNAQVQAAFLFIPLLKCEGRIWSPAVMLGLSFIIIGFFTCSLRHKSKETFGESREQAKT